MHGSTSSKIAAGFRHALDWAGRNDHVVVRTCPFGRSNVRKHPRIRSVAVPQRA